MEQIGNQPQSPSCIPINPGLHFNNAIISGGDFRSIQGGHFEYHQPNFQYSESGLFALSQSIARGATHDSAERYPPGKCHAGTREEIITIILDWIKVPNPTSDVLWLYGPAGAGKSAIMQTIAELLVETSYEGRYAGSFFFGRDIDGRCDGKNLFSTLAYQIAMRLPGMRALVNDAMNSDHTLPHKSMDIQLKSLIVEPLARSSSFLHTPTIIIDGLDECRDSRTQREILSLITNARTKSLVPLRFLIASRPEFWIRECFDDKLLFDITIRLSLSDSRDADKDIKKYLQDGFAKIYAENLDIMGEVEQPWPSEKLIDYFVHNASGQFIYASTVLKFVDSPSDFHHPQEQLKIISTPGPLQASAFSDLDALYTKILSVYPRRDELLTVLGGLQVLEHEEVPLRTINIFLGVGSIELKMTLRALESLVNFSFPQQMVADPMLDKLYGQNEIEFVRFHHLSFCEFLKDSTRSGAFSIDTQFWVDRLWDGFFDALVNSLRGIMTHIAVPIIHHKSASSNFRRIFANNASPGRMRDHMEYLLARVLEFRRENRRLQGVQLKYLLRHLQYAEDFIVSVTGDPSWTTEPNVDPLRFYVDQDPFENLLVNIRAVQDSTIREIIAIDGLSFSSMMAYFTSSAVYSFNSLRYSGFSLPELRYLSGASNDTVRSFLLENAHFFDAFAMRANRDYRPLACVLEFLGSLRGQSFHIAFRSHCIRACRSILLRFCCPMLASSDLEVAKRNQDILNVTLCGFFSDDSLSNIALVQDPEDLQIMKNIIDIMYHCDWKQVPMCSINGPFTVINRILGWLRRHMGDVMFLSENSGSSKMVEIISHLYNAVVLPELSESCFSELFMYRRKHRTLLCLSESSLSLLDGTEISEEVETSILDERDIRTPYAFIHGFGLDEYFSAISIISRILKESPSEVGIKLSDWFTLVSEFYLHLLAKNHYHALDPNYTCYFHIPTTPAYDLWLLHAIPTNKILLALRAIRYLCLKQHRRWKAPTGFCSFAIGLLQKSDLAEGGLKFWFEDLKVNDVKGENENKDDEDDDDEEVEDDDDD